MSTKKYLQAALFSVVVSLVIGGIIIACLGVNPFSAFYNLLQGCGLAPKAKYGGGKSMLTDLSGYIDCLTPMLFAALSCAVAMKVGLFNIGISGQMLTAGFIATITIGYSELPGIVAKPLVVVIGMLTGMAIGALMGFLKYKFNVNEVVSSIMLNYIAMYIISFFIQTQYVDPVSRQSTSINSAARLTFHQIQIGDYKYDLPIGFILAIIAVVVVKFMFDRTDYGFELKAVGLNKTAAEYAGIHVGRTIVSSMAISGALAGLAGVTYYLGYYASIQPKVLISTGYDAIAVCLLGNSDPVGIVFSTFLIEIIDKGSTYMSSQAGLESEIADVITGIILLFSACNMFFIGLADRRKQKKEAEAAAAAGVTQTPASVSGQTPAPTQAASSGPDSETAADTTEGKEGGSL